jgi:hypothetical protein
MTHARVPTSSGGGVVALSGDLLELLKTLDRAELDIQYLIGHLNDLIAIDPPHQTAEEQRDAEDTTIEIQELVKLVVRAKQEATFRISPSTIATLREFVSESHLDEYFTVQALTSIGGVTGRWTTLSHLGFAKSPGERVAASLRQAVGCYLYGMHDAAAVLCRTVLEFALRDRLGRVGDQAEEVRTDLENLIGFCARAKVISPEVRQYADRIRKLGNGAVHTGSCDEPRALRQLLDTREVLAHLYGEATT